MDLGGRIKKIRKSRGLTQKQLAQKMSLDQSYIARIERGSRVISIPLGIELAEVMDCKIEDFYQESSDIEDKDIQISKNLRL